MTDANGIAAKRVRDARGALGWTQEHLAGAAGVSSKTVKRIEAGAAISPDSLRDVCAALGLDFAAAQGGGGAAAPRAPEPPYAWIGDAAGEMLTVRGNACSVLRVDGAVAPLGEAGLARLSTDLYMALSP